ncbi:hypothetical protein B0T24DRAFT_618151 [Lasiosphaeria ovina]|uniref:Uncharacterized protein n=1 Tax=Lasiosphaeria ovina TaxID=92902 RepID=A0AAE0KG26_9PEZI|nr:hypothetical protein B0T24DRAFT_618151 [Lasiosphaeria ovina]
MLWLLKEPNVLRAIEGSAPELAPFGASPTAVSPPLYLANNLTPFKPVMHGQARFTKLMIVDKFGQIVSGMQPADYAGNSSTERYSLYPCVSPGLTCGIIHSEGSQEGHYLPNTTVKADDGPNVCQFFQIPPRINQHARLNVRFLMPSAAGGSKPTEPTGLSGNTVRRVATEWDNPIWAWLVTNFQSHSVQVYDGDGRFVQEAIILEGSKPNTHRVKLSMGPNSSGYGVPPDGRLEQLLEAMQQPEILVALFDMLAGAADSGWQATSADLDGMLPAVFGRPFCIADLGASIELASPPLSNACLLASSSSPRSDDLASILGYEFPVGLGNHTAAFDGLVGTFPAQGPIKMIATAYSLDAMEAANTPEDSYRSDEYRPQPLLLKPYFVHGDVGENHDEAQGSFAAAHDAQLAKSCVSVIVDAKLPIHVYSGSLFPMAEISLPQLSVDTAMSNMHAFFSVGPTLVPEKPRTDLVRVMMGGEDDGLVMASGPTLQMPTGGTDDKGRWRWMQPKVEGEDEESESDAEDAESGSGELVGATTWFPVQMLPVDGSLKVEAAAQSELVEGYIMVGSTSR